MKCRSVRKRLGDYVDGQLAPPQMAAVEEHLDGCEGCRREGAELRATIRLVSQSGRFQCPVDCSPYVLARLCAAPQRGTRFSWPALSLALRASVAATAAAGAVAAIIAGLALHPGVTPRIPIPPAPPPVAVAAVEPAEWHDASRTQQALGSLDSLVLELPSVSSARAQTLR